MSDSHKPQTITVQFHFGAEHTSFESGESESLASLKLKALTNLKIVIDPSIDYLLSFEGKTVENETITLGQLLGDHVRPHVEFQIKKRPKGGAPR
jgi:hypothetical protein